MKTCIVPKNGPQAVGPYSQAVLCGSFIFLSGQIPLDPQSGTIVGTTIEEQTTQVIANIQVILEENSLTLGHIIKTTVFLQNMDNFHGMNAIYSKYFKSDYPARSTIEVARLPKDALIEIEAIASAKL